MLKQVKEKKILRIIVDEKLTFKSHVEYICTEARKSYGHLAAIPMLSPANYVTIYKSFIRSHLEYCCAAWSHRIYHNSNLKLVESTQREALSLILRSFKSIPTVALEAELGVLPIDIRLQELNRMECLKLLRKNDITFKDKLIASFKNQKPSPLQNLAKPCTRLLSHLLGETNIDINKIRVETEPTTSCKNFTNIKRVRPELPPTDTNSEDRKTLHIQFVTKLLNDMKESTIAIFTDGSSLINPEPTGAGADICSAGMNKPPIKLAKATMEKLILFL